MWALEFKCIFVYNHIMRRTMYKILSISGGGVKGIIPALVCTHIELKTGKPIRDTFDYISGSSVGSILGGLLSAGVPAATIAKTMINDSKYLFRKKFFFGRFFGGAKYDRRRLRGMIEGYLKRHDCLRMGDVRENKLAITTFGRIANRTHYLTSWNDPQLKMIDAISWSALSAAYYFGQIHVPQYTWTCKYQSSRLKRYRGEIFQDGGQGTHNYTCEDSLRMVKYGLGIDWNEDVRVLNLGCGNSLLMTKDVNEALNDSSFGQIRDYLSQARNEAPYDQVTNTAYILKNVYKNRDHFCNIDPVIDEKKDVLDGVKYIDYYRKKGQDCVRELPHWLS